MNTLSDTRREYDYTQLSKKQLDSNPFAQMKKWLDQAQQANLKDATVMTLATTDNNALPDARIVMLKQLDEKGFCWFTHYASKKGQQLAHNPQACLLFYWREFDRQVAIRGRVEKLSTQAAEAYFHSRPLNSQFSGAASAQSQPIESREALENKLQQLKKANPDAVEKPENWGGYRLIPATFEFWQGRENRLHDRFRYTHDNDNDSEQWTITRLQP
ncbi:Pyridoxamine 5'-phosphate oxidase [hydrothermal vent metagenome]|uniref:Pyridoxamine 5'-phosphate oxidase n=1 Tax=hydrothermal vent metagenome TaxID=652676 RepID=A0A3B0XUE6_9ZZZZ